MPKLPGVNHLAAVRALEKIGVIRQGKHITMSDGLRTIQIPRARLELEFATLRYLRFLLLVLS